ncbi:Protein of unknown function [Gryllus bimaculatus]|nr:Protein of unknown function [Gryllus bimaculatus]
MRARGRQATRHRLRGVPPVRPGLHPRADCVRDAARMPVLRYVTGYSSVVLL